jgi:hypothetical protein
MKHREERGESGGAIAFENLVPANTVTFCQVTLSSAINRQEDRKRVVC